MKKEEKKTKLNQDGLLLIRQNVIAKTFWNALKYAESGSHDFFLMTQNVILVTYKGTQLDLELR